MFKKMDDCSDVDINDVENWLEADNDGGYSTLTGEEIIASCSSKDAENITDSYEDDEYDPLVIMTQLEATARLDEVMNYMERQADTTPTELLMLKQLKLMLSVPLESVIQN